MRPEYSSNATLISQRHFSRCPRYGYSVILQKEFGSVSQTPLIAHGQGAWNPTMTADGLKILFQARVDAMDGDPKSFVHHYDLFLHEYDKITRLTRIRSHFSDAVISPDGKQAVFWAWQGSPGSRDEPETPVKFYRLDIATKVITEIPPPLPLPVPES